MCLITAGGLQSGEPFNDRQLDTANSLGKSRIEGSLINYLEKALRFGSAYQIIAMRQALVRHLKAKYGVWRVGRKDAK